MSIIKKRKVDNKGRVSLPFMKNKEIFFVKKGQTIILSEDSSELEQITKEIDDKVMLKKFQALKEWFELVEEAELSDISSKDIDKKIGESLSKKLEF